MEQTGPPIEESEIKRRIRAWVRHSKSLRILLSGKTGSGKSSLINTLLGKNVAQEGDSIISETREVGSHSELKDTLGPLPELQATINTIQITIWDTPGLKDPSTDEESTLKEIKEKCRDQVDLLVYCIQITQTRAGQDEYDAIADLTRALGADIWKNAVFALTFANELHPSASYQGSPEAYYTSRVHDWKQVIAHALVNAGISQAVAEKVPIVPTGYRQQPILNRHEWFSDFWTACLMRMRILSIPAILTVSYEESLNDPSRRALNSRLIAERLKQIGDKINREHQERISDLISLGGVQSQVLFRYLSDEIRQSMSQSISSSFPTVIASIVPRSRNNVLWKLFLFGGVLIIGFSIGRYLYRRL